MDQSPASRMNIDNHRGIRPKRTVTLIAGLIAAASATALKADNMDSHDDSMSLTADGRFSTLYEPSGVVPLPDGRFLIVEDEPERALRLVSIDLSGDNTISLKNEAHLGLPQGLTTRLAIGELDDLEGAAHDQTGRLYVVSSHDDSAPHWGSKRQKLLRFSIQDGRMHEVSRILTLRRDLLVRYPQLEAESKNQGKKKKEAGAMNIEALAYDRSRDDLLIGFRTPVLDGKSIIVRLMNPDAYLSDDAPPELDESLWSVDLDEGGIRAMTYDDQSDQLLLISRRENHKKDSYKLWRMAADGQTPATRIDIGDQEDMLKNVEGIAPVNLGQSSASGLLLVRDNGNEKKGRGGDWFILSRKQLGLDS